MHLLRQNSYLQCVDLARTDSNICSPRTLFKTTCVEDSFAFLKETDIFHSPFVKKKKKKKEKEEKRKRRKKKKKIEMYI